LRLERIANVIKVYRDGVQVTGAEVTDSSEASGTGNRLAGMTHFGTVGTEDTAFDNFGYGDIVSGTQVVQVPPTDHRFFLRGIRR
jgi:hypothetical protein